MPHMRLQTAQALSSVVPAFSAKLDLVDAYGRTALHVAAQHGQINALSEILGRSVDTDAKDVKGGETALHYAASSGKVLVRVQGRHIYFATIRISSEPVGANVFI